MNMSLLLLVSCTRLYQLEARLFEAEIQNAEQEIRLAELENELARQAASAGPSAADEGAAQTLYEQAMTFYEDQAYEQATIFFAQLQAQYSGTRAAQKGERILTELQVFGKAVPDSLNVEHWYQGEAVDLHSENPTIIVFWEEWCPHCRREVPNLNETFLQYQDQGLNVIGLTRVSRSSTDEAVTQFIEENNIAYPMARENGDSATYFSIRGIPAVAVVQNGVVVWRGHPGRIREDMLTAWLQ